MFKHAVQIGFLGLCLALVLDQTALAQRGGWGGRGGGDDRGEEMRRRFEEMRGRFGGGDSGRGGSPWGGGFPGWGGRDGDGDRDRDRGRDGDRSDRNRGEDRSRDGGRGSTPRVQPFVPTPHTPIGVDLPGNYVAGDADGDKQIDLMEWRQWKPQEIAEFMRMDRNKDGFLTARELVIAENHPDQVAGPASNVAAVYQASTPTTPTPSGPDADGNPAPAGEKPSAAEARWVFGQLDKNKNGQIEDSEWQGSKTIRAGFEKSGIQIKLPTDQATFLNLYPPQRLVPQVPLPG